jgi:hypothetical protein
MCGSESISTTNARTPKPAKSNVASHPIERHIRIIRGQNVMLGTDLAVLHEVPTRVLNRGCAATAIMYFAELGRGWDGRGATS